MDVNHRIIRSMSDERLERVIAKCQVWVTLCQLGKTHTWDDFDQVMAFEESEGLAAWALANCLAERARRVAAAESESAEAEYPF